jgi:hypothetical protein
MGEAYIGDVVSLDSTSEGAHLIYIATRLGCPEVNGDWS